MRNSVDLQQRDDTITQCMATSSLWQRFPEWLEQEYKQSVASNNQVFLRLVICIGVSLFFLTGIVDLIVSEQWQQTIIVRYVMAGPILLGLIFITLTRWVNQFEQFIIVISTLIFAIALATVAIIMSDPYQNIYYSGFVLIVLYFFSLTQQHFILSLALMICVLLILNVAVVIDGDKSQADLLQHNLIFIGASIPLMVNNIFRDRHKRQQFLQQKYLEVTQSKLKIAQKELKRLARIDGLTGLANRRHFIHHYQREWLRAQRYGYALSLCLIDFDNFKQFNDQYGHLAGDKGLQTIAKLLPRFTRRPGDLAGRYGGDEFIMLLVDTQHSSAMIKAEQLRQAVIGSHIEHKHNPSINLVSITIGVATLTPNDSNQPQDLLHSADQALLRAKKQGRNQVAQ